MQEPPFQKEIHLPYSKWSQHRADNGLIYLAHPVTGEVKWLWSRHHDPKTEHDYLVNTITGKRQWVTKENAHFCPLKPNTQADASANASANAKLQNSTTTTTPPIPPVNAIQETSAYPKNRRSSASNHFVNMPTAPAKVAAAPKEDGANHTKPKYREIAAPKSLGLTADEVLMLVPDSGRRYIFNKKTKSSRWLPDREPDTITNEERQKPPFGGSKASKQASSPLNDDDDIHRELKMKTQVPMMGTVPHGKTSSNGVEDTACSMGVMAQPGHEQKATPARRNVQAARPLNGQGDRSRTAQPGGEDEDKVDEISRRLGALNTILADVSKITTSDKYNMTKLRRLSREAPSREDAQTGSQRLLELEEYLTQQMLKVDGVESEGNQVIRAKRKETVKAILALTEEIELLREELAS